MPKNTLSKKKDFDQIFKTGQSFYCPILGIKALKNKLDDNRYGIMVGLKVSKKAVVRNKIKRQIREVLKDWVFSKEGFYDIVVIVHKNILERDFLDIKEALLGLLKKIK